MSNNKDEHNTNNGVCTQQLKETAERLEQKETIIERSPICTKIISLERKLMYMSSAGVNGLKIDDISQFYDRPYPPTGFSKVLTELYDEHFPKALSGKTTCFECPIPDMEGHEEWYITHFIPIYYPNSAKLHFILASSACITDRKQKEFETEALQDELMQVSRQLGMSEIACNVIHNVGNVLNTVNVSIDVLQAKHCEEQTNKILKLLTMMNDNIDGICAATIIKKWAEPWRNTSHY